MHDIAAALTAAGLGCEVAGDMWAAIWEKLAFTAAMNALAAVTRLTVGQLGATPTVAGSPTPSSRRSSRSPAARRSPPTALRCGRPEIDYRNGAVVREAEALGMACQSPPRCGISLRMREPAA